MPGPQLALDRFRHRYGDDLRALLGNKRYKAVRQAGISFGNTDIAEAGFGGDVTVNKQYWKDASRAERFGILAHELTHVAGIGSKSYDTSQPWGERRAEIAADAVRLATIGERDGWTASKAATRYAGRRGWTDMVAGNTGPRPGNEARRSRNTLVNNASKQQYPGGYQAPISSASAVQYGDQLAQARYGYLQQLAMLKQQRAQAGVTARIGRADARSAAVGNMAGTVSDAISRGVIGSSADLSARSGVIADRQRALAEVEAQRAQDRLDVGYQALGARNDYYGQLSSIQNAMAQEQMANSISAFQSDQFDALLRTLSRVRDQKSGNAPRQRRGVNAPPSYPNSGVGSPGAYTASVRVPLYGQRGY